MTSSSVRQWSPGAAWWVGIWLALGYVGIYLCRKNLAVAIPQLQEAFGVGKAELGAIASLGTVAYAVGKFLSGPLVDRLGGRRGFLLSMGGVALFGALGGLAPGLGALAFAYSLNRLSGSAGWNGMVRILATWAPPARLATAIAALSISYVGGGMVATLFARQLVTWGAGWRGVMGLPSVALLLLLAACALTVRNGPFRLPRLSSGGAAQPLAGTGKSPAPVSRLLARPEFLAVCGLSFALTLLREALGTWSVDYLHMLQRGAGSTGSEALAAAALGSTAFEVAGIASILGMGYLYDRLPRRLRRWVIAGMLAVLAAVLALLALPAALGPGSAAILLGAVGLCSYGPYSLLAGAMAVECGGEELTATAAGIIDGVGYVAAILAGYTLGLLLDKAGYPAAFALLAVLTLTSAANALLLRFES